jgi:class 3 adenylate cyclase
MERRLAAILAADVIGYSRLMAADEAATLEALKAHRRQLINLAARLEALAEPDGLCISDLAHSQVVGRLDATFAPGGLQQLKNIADPVKVWRWPAAAVEPAANHASALPGKPSLVVLPFLNMTGDPAREVVADGFTEDVINQRVPDRQSFRHRP